MSLRMSCGLIFWTSSTACHKRGLYGMSDLQLKAPLTINWAINNSCNFACSHCYSREDTHDELPRDVLYDCIKKVAQAGVFSVNFGGGEPLLRPDLLDIAAFSNGLGLRVSMNSNGWLIDHDKAAALKKAGFTKVGIS